MERSVFLGVASFVFMLKTLGIDFYLSGEAHIVLWPKNKYFSFGISAENRSPPSCGYIKTNNVALKEVFSKNDLETIMEVCEREYVKETRGVSHCSISKDPVKRGNISTVVNRREFNCLYA